MELQFAISFLVVIEEIGLGVCLPGHRMALRRIVRQGRASLGTPVPGYNGKRRPLRSQQPNHSSLAMGPDLVCEFPNRPMRLLEANRDDLLKTVLLRGTKQRYIAYLVHHLLVPENRRKTESAVN